MKAAVACRFDQSGFYRTFRRIPEDNEAVLDWGTDRNHIDVSMAVSLSLENSELLGPKSRRIVLWAVILSILGCVIYFAGANFASAARAPKRKVG